MGFGVCGGNKQPVKYTFKEYQQLEANSKKLMERLEVGVRDVERAAFVIMSRGKGKVKKTTAIDVRNAHTAPSQERRHEKKESKEDISNICHAEAVFTR